ncbi:UDP-3-O-acyl-N-acetylglucosamine deacetylase [uncultured Cetobacterium sp.]|uniref:UDP-3-O-acyl-N-acetylglucosamine deacetylase n=1 Tax=uncultured Cetobacterium sp. TaxID=527638 RepID=UPI00260BA3AB|nr:UDP-3-O-acyl-N-acetylglucosamine deacetylase [uncultured Cetobacterium sp.]
MKRKTLREELVYNGIGLHKGEDIKLKLIPAENGGIIFKRIDLEDGKNEILMDIENSFDLTRGTNLRNEFGASVYTIEHFLSALYIMNITDLIVELDGNELPILDGSAKIFVELLEEIGTRDLTEDVEEIVIKSATNLTVGDKHIVGLPFDGYKITYTIKFDHSFLKSQMLEVEVDLETYKDEIAKARTFGFDYEVEYLKQNNLALGGTLENAIVIKKDGVLNPSGLRYEDEFVRHKILDLIGDLKVLNRPIKGHIIAIKAGHALDIEFARLLKKQEEKTC